MLFPTPTSPAPTLLLALATTLGACTPYALAMPRQLLGVVPDGQNHNSIRLVNYTFPPGAPDVRATLTSSQPCTITPCNLSPGKGTTGGEMTPSVTVSTFESHTGGGGGGGVIVVRDAATGAKVTTSKQVADTLYGVQNACEMGCSNGESLVYEHCNFMAVMTSGRQDAPSLVCVMMDGTVTAREPLPAEYSVATSGPFSSHARILGLDSYCVVASSDKDSAIFCLNPEFDFDKNKLVTTLTSFHHTIPAATWGQSSGINPIVSLLGYHPQEPNTLLVLMASKSSVTSGPGPDELIRTGLYIAALDSNNQPPGKATKATHLVDLPSQYAAAIASAPVFASMGFGFIDHDATYPMKNTAMLAGLQDVSGHGIVNKLVRVPVPWPPGAAVNTTTDKAAVEEWLWDTSMPQVISFIPAY